ncbi:MAG: hypothetical protein ACM338_12655 [Betaproteobacteria bacterium]
MTIPILWIAVVLSILIHVAALWMVLTRARPLAMNAPERGRTSTLAVQLAPRRAPAPSAAPAPSPPKIALRAAPRPVIRPPRAKPVTPRPAAPKPPPLPLAVPDRSAPRSVVPETPAAPAPEAMPPPPAVDLAAYIAAQRRARGEAPAPSASEDGNEPRETERERRNRIAAANLGLDRTPTFGRDPRNAGGLFQITELNYDNAEFYFFGFDKDIGRNAKQRIEVSKGNNSDIRIAVVRKMISIIRENVSGDFTWVSQRLGRQVRLSARPEDNAGLEDFIMHDIFPDARQP